MEKETKESKPAALLSAFGVSAGSCCGDGKNRPAQKRGIPVCPNPWAQEASPGFFIFSFLWSRGFLTGIRRNVSLLSSLGTFFFLSLSFFPPS